MELSGKNVLLTGASGGIGQAIARSLDSQGAILTLVGRDEKKLDELRQSLTHPEKHQCLSLDLTQDNAIQRLSDFSYQALSEGCRFDVVINNAGNNVFSFLGHRSGKSVEQELKLNLEVPVLISQSALCWLARPGIILNIGSAFGSIGYPGYASYCAAKAGVMRFSEALDRELDGTGIRVLYLAPRATETDLNNDTVKEMNKALGNHSDSPDTVARYVIQSLQKEKAMTWIGWPEKLFVKINQIFPSLVSKSIRKQQETIHHFVNQIHLK